MTLSEMEASRSPPGKQQIPSFQSILGPGIWTRSLQYEDGC